MELIVMKKNLAICSIVLISLLSVSLWAQEKETTPLPVATPTPGITDLFKLLESENPADRVRAKATLVKRGEAVGPALLEELTGASPRKAYDLLIVLRYSKYRGGNDILKKLFGEGSDERVKLAAAMMLCRLDDNYSFYQGYIADQARKGADEERLQAMQMLGYLEDVRAVPVLKEIFYDESQPDKIRQAALWDLAHTPVKEAAQTLVSMVNDPHVDWFYKEILIAALRRLATEPGMAEIVSEYLEEAQRLPDLGKAPTPPSARE
jgi:hypothetical protein